MIPSISHVLFLKGGQIVLCGKRETVLSPENVSETLGLSVRRSVRIPGRKITRAGESGTARQNTPLVSIRNADVHLDGKKILEEIRWKMLKDENWAILGKNGAGKSTLLKLIRGDIHPALGGTISRFGIREGDIMDVKRRIGYLSSELQGTYDSDLTGEEVVHSGFFSSIGLYREVTERQKEIAKKWILFFGVRALCGKGIFSMSYGELRKILVVRAMVNHPGILILDEPCSGLDMPARKDLLNALEKLAGTGTGIIMVTHHPEDLIPSITHLLVMEKGRVIDKGRKEKILGKKSLADILGDLSRSPSRPHPAPIS